MSKYLFVPQGCYIEISPDTDSSCIGLFTLSMTTCYPVIVATKEHIFLCHADLQTDISDEKHGIPAWVKSIACKNEKDIIKIYLFSGYSDADNPYKDKISQFLEKSGIKKRCEIISSSGKYTEIMVYRNGEIIGEILSEHHKHAHDYFNYNSFITACLNAQESPRSRPPIKIFSSEQSKFYTASHIVHINAWLSEVANKLNRNNSYVDIKNPYFKNILFYLVKLNVRELRRFIGENYAKLCGEDFINIAKLIASRINNCIAKVLSMDEEQPSKPIIDAGDFCSDIIAKHINFLIGKVYCQLDADLLQNIIGLYILEMFNPKTLSIFNKAIDTIFEQGFTDHLEILILSKIFEMNFIISSPFYEHPIIFYNSVEKQKTIYLLYDVKNNQRTYCFRELKDELVQHITEKQNIFFQLPSACNSLFMVLQRKCLKLPEEDPRISQSSSSATLFAAPTPRIAESGSRIPKLPALSQNQTTQPPSSSSSAPQP